MNTLFNLDAYYQPESRYTSDPYWDKLESQTQFLDDNNPEFIDDSVTNQETENAIAQKDSLTFEVDNIYWHPGKQLKVKLLKIFKNGKADVYFEKDFNKHKIWLSELTTLDVRESESTVPQNDSLTTQSINIYKPSGKARGNSKYFRYSYRDGSRIKHIHIPGGNISNPLAKQRAKIIDDAIAQKLPPTEIKSMIRHFKTE
ncbi:MAG: hypothetical protein F6K62_12800 [Sphaerospermopsis sp. SIO1G2]|nr:hypothetical protein [Sphaerospermopsis sp. SIO1G2]